MRWPAPAPPASLKEQNRTEKKTAITFDIDGIPIRNGQNIKGAGGFPVTYNYLNMGLF